MFKGRDAPMTGLSIDSRLEITAASWPAGEGTAPESDHRGVPVLAASDAWPLEVDPEP